jgi:copper chaperone
VHTIPPDRMEAALSASESRTYTVQGMSCEHCRASVREAVGEIGGVTSVEADLASGVLEVEGSGFTDAAIVAAVELAGYRVADGP